MDKKQWDKTMTKEQFEELYEDFAHYYTVIEYSLMTMRNDVENDSRADINLYYEISENMQKIKEVFDKIKNLI